MPKRGAAWQLGHTAGSRFQFFSVMPGLVPGIHVFDVLAKTWMAAHLSG